MTQKEKNDEIPLKNRIQCALKAAQAIINEHPATISIKLKDLYGDAWIFKGAEGRQFGKNFQDKYNNGDFKGIKQNKTHASDNAIRYKIIKSK